MVHNHANTDRFIAMVPEARAVMDGGNFDPRQLADRLPSVSQAHRDRACIYMILYGEFPERRFGDRSYSGSNSAGKLSETSGEGSHEPIPCRFHRRSAGEDAPRSQVMRRLLFPCHDHAVQLQRHDSYLPMLQLPQPPVHFYE